MSEKLLTDTGMEVLLHVVVLPIFAGPAIFVWQVFKWLQTAQWIPVSLETARNYFGFRHPHVEWAGVQQIIDYLLDAPLSIVASAIWMAVIVFTIVVIEEHHKAKRLKP